MPTFAPSSRPEAAEKAGGGDSARCWDGSVLICLRN